MDVAALVRRTAAACLVALTTVTAGCIGTAPEHDEPSSLVVGYHDAAQRLAVLDQAEATDQLRDWARLGLASSLGMDRDRIVDALFDTTPVRDPAFTGLVEQPIGPGRGLFDGNTLHVLVPEDDRHASRTTGLILDQYRADAGTDPAQIRRHRYRVDRERQRIELFPEPPAATADVRRDNGWHEARVDQLDGLSGFLAVTDHLSRLETRGTELWAAGWDWKDAPGARVTADDVAVLQRGYDQETGPLPGFSLDPARAAGVEDVRAAVPGLASGIPEAIFSGNWAGTGYTSAAELRESVEVRLFQPSVGTGPADGLPEDRTELWALLNVLRGEPVFSQAGYYGGLAGTEVGFSLFYTDLVAKMWVTGVGSGVPSLKVPGFVPDPQVPTPPNLCPRQPHEESGRLWFGQGDAAFAFSETGVHIGAQATRLFSRSNGGAGTEVESSYDFARGLRFWDRHYLEIADHEPQYHRLEQLMRWSGVIEWLTATGRSARLPTAPHSATGPSRSFADWYVRHAEELHERAPVAFVAPPSAQSEAVLPTPSQTTSDCGLLKIVGGVSLADGMARSGGTPSGTAVLPGGTRRAHPVDPDKTHYDPATGSQRFERVTHEGRGEVSDRITFDVRRGPDGTSSRVVGGHRESIPFAEARLVVSSGEREFQNNFRSDGPDFVFDSAYQGVPASSVRVREVPISGASHRQTDITVRPGQLDRLADAVKRVGKDPERGLDGAQGLLYREVGPEGQAVYRFEDMWIEVGTGHTSSHVVAYSEVVTPGGTVQVRVVLPRQLTTQDVTALQPVETGTTRLAELPDEIPAGAAVYVADLPSLVGPEQPRAPAEPIPFDARVKFVVARTTGDPGPPRSVPERATWELSDVNRFRDGSTDTRTGVSTGSSDSRAGVFGSVLRGPGGWIVLISVCPRPEQPQPSQSTQPGVPQEEACG